ncbi:MAG: gamma-glutamyltransferase [Solirubrobacterales bacterium]
MSKSMSPSVGRRITRGLGPAALAVIGLTACGPEKPVGTIGHVSGFGGVVAADEPRAVIAARDTLSAGGTAADAAVALYFTLAVTQPSTASLGGGGVCVVHSGGKTPKTEVVDFQAVAPQAAASARIPTAVPANVRGFYALHAKFGRLRWEKLLAEPERLARFGAPISRALAADLAKAAPVLARDPAARRIFFRPDGRTLAEGDRLEQPDLAVTLSRIRYSAGDLYGGQAARALVQGAAQAGMSLTIEDLRDIKPQAGGADTIKIGNEVAYFVPAPSSASGAAAEMVKTAVDRPAEREAALTRVANAAPANAPNPASGFVILDSEGGAVTCGVSTHGLFGNGHVIPGTGVVAAAAPGINGAPAAVAPVLVVNPNVHEVRFGGVAAGGARAPSAVAATLLAVMRDGTKLDAAMPRPAAGASPLQALSPTRVNAFACGSGKASFASCSVVTDPDGYGMTATVGKD